MSQGKKAKKLEERVEPHFSAPTNVPPYTQSLDAKIPGENIVFVKHELRSAKWIAIHREPSGPLFIGIGNTEALARRIAALKAFRDRPEDKVPVTPVHATDLNAVLTEISLIIEQSNDLRINAPHEQQQILDELNRSRSLLAELRDDPVLFLTFTLPILSYIAAKFADTILQHLADKAIDIAQRLVGF